MYRETLDQGCMGDHGIMRRVERGQLGNWFQCLKSYLSLALFMHVYFWECVLIRISVWRDEMTEERRGLAQGRKGEFSQNLIRRLTAHDLPLGYSWNLQHGSGQHMISWFWGLVREMKIGGMRILCLSFNELKCKNW